MRTSFVCLLSLICFVMVCTAAEDQTAKAKDSDLGGEWTGTIDIVPGAILANLEASDFDMRGDGEEEEMTLISTMPSVAAGLSYERPNGYFNIKGGGGILLNARLRSWILYGTAEYLWEVDRSMTIGPHISYAYFADPEWWGDGVVEFDETDALMVGMTVEMGDRISYIMSIDYYFDFEFDVKEGSVGPGWVASGNKIDMSGIAAQFGIRLHY